MKKTLMVFAWLVNIFSAKAQKSIYDSYPVYKGNDLGLTYSSKNNVFKIWAPTAEQAQLIFYKEGIGGNPISTFIMTKDKEGVWNADLIGEFKSWFYTFRVMVNGKWLNEVPDPYAKAVGVNGKRAVVIDLKETNPIGWEKDKSPEFKNKTDAILYELHIRDATISANSGIKSGNGCCV